jgi:hypothetical protein
MRKIGIIRPFPTMMRPQSNPRRMMVEVKPEALQLKTMVAEVWF